MRYCSKCGSSLEEYGDAVSYDPFTGKPNYRTRCSRNPCHTYHEYEEISDTRKTGIISTIQGLFFTLSGRGVTYKCKVCGGELFIPEENFDY